MMERDYQRGEYRHNTAFDSKYTASSTNANPQFTGTGASAVRTTFSPLDPAKMQSAAHRAKSFITEMHTAQTTEAGQVRSGRGLSSRWPVGLQSVGPRLTGSNGLVPPVKSK